MTPHYPYELVWMTTEKHGTPHARALLAANPGLSIHVSSPPAGADGEAYFYGWRNCDRNIRAWWRANGAAVAKDEVIFLEYDVFCNMGLSAVLPPLARGVGAAGGRIMTAVADRRTFWPFCEIHRLPLHLRSFAIGIAPLAFLQISRAALDDLCDPEYDAVFALDLFCELRLPTVIRRCGYNIMPLPLPGVGVRALHPRPEDRGIFHPVKHPVL